MKGSQNKRKNAKKRIFEASFTSKFPMTVGPTIKPLEFREANIIISNRSVQIFDIILHFEIFS